MPTRPLSPMSPKVLSPRRLKCLKRLKKALADLSKQVRVKTLKDLQPVSDVVFDTIDSDHSGWISKKEFKGFVEIFNDQLGIWSANPEEQFKKIDENGDNFIDKQEFSKFLFIICRERGKQALVGQLGLAIELMPRPGVGEGMQDPFDRLRDCHGCVIEKTEERGITLSQLCRLLSHVEKYCTVEGWRDDFLDREVKWREANLYLVTAKVVKPATEMRRCSYVEFIAPTRQPPIWFVSHWWGEPVEHFYHCLKQHARDRNLVRDSPYWVCAYANNQWDVESELGLDPEQSSFRKAMRAKGTKGTVSIVDKKAVCFKRLWCCYEVYISLEQEGYEYDIYTSLSEGGVCAVGITTSGPAEVDLHENPLYPDDAKHTREARFPMSLMDKTLDIRLQEGETSREEDRRRILNTIVRRKGRELDAEPLREDPEYDTLNSRLHGLVAMSGLRDALEVGSKTVTKRMLAQLKRCDLPAMEISFDSCDEVTDELVRKLVDTITEELTILSLDFSFCMFVSNETLRILAAGLQRPLELSKLVLRFMTAKSRDDMLNDDGLGELAAALPPALRHLELDLRGCKGISDEGVADLLGLLPRKLEFLKLDLSYIGSLRCLTMCRLAEGLPRGLVHLELAAETRGGNRQADVAMQDSSIRALADRLPRALRSLSLNVSFAPLLLTDDGMQDLYSALPGSLDSLSVNAYLAKALTGGALPRRLPRALTRLNLLSFRKVEDEGITALCLALPATLQELKLEAQTCADLTFAGIEALLSALPRLPRLRRLELDLQGFPDAERIGAEIEACLESTGCVWIQDASGATKWASV